MNLCTIGETLLTFDLLAPANQPCYSPTFIITAIVCPAPPPSPLGSSPPPPSPLPLFSRHVASPVLRRHISLPHATRRLGQRSYHTPGAPAPESSADTPASTAPNAVDGSGDGGGSAAGDWEVASPPKVPGRREEFGVGDRPGFEPGIADGAWGGEGVIGEGVRGCAEWAMSFSGDLKQGTTTVKVHQ